MLEDRAQVQAPTDTVLRAFREAVLVVMSQSDVAGRDFIQPLQLIRRTPTLVPQQLAVLAAQEKALAEAISERIGQPTGDVSQLIGEVPHPTGEVSRPIGDVYPPLCAAAVLTALRVVLDGWLQRSAGTDQEPDPELLGRQVDTVLSELSAGLDRPGGLGPDPDPPGERSSNGR